MVSLPRNRGMRYVFLSLVVLIMSVEALAACGQSGAASSLPRTPKTVHPSQSSIAAITVTATEYAFDLPVSSVSPTLSVDRSLLH